MFERGQSGLDQGSGHPKIILGRGKHRLRRSFRRYKNQDKVFDLDHPKTTFQLFYYEELRYWQVLARWMSKQHY